MSAIDHWDWIRWALALALVACNIGVWRGVALEESHDRIDVERGKTLLIKSLALEALFAFVLFVVDTKSSLDQKWQIASLHDRAAQAELELQKLKSPRAISDENEKVLIASLHQFAGTEFWVLIEKGEKDVFTEQEAFGLQLRKIFFAAGWKPTNHWSRIDSAKIDPEYVPVSDRGCQIVFANEPQSTEIGHAVDAAFRKVGIECVLSPDTEIKYRHIDIAIGLR